MIKLAMGHGIFNILTDKEVEQMKTQVRKWAHDVLVIVVYVVMFVHYVIPELIAVVSGILISTGTLIK